MASLFPTLLEADTSAATSAPLEKSRRSCWTFWSGQAPPPPAPPSRERGASSYLPVHRNEQPASSPARDLARQGSATLRVRNAGEVLQGLGKASAEFRVWQVMLVVVPVEVALYACLSTWLGVDSGMTVIAFAVWLNIRFLIHSVTYMGCAGPSSRMRSPSTMRARLFAGVVAMLPFVWLLPWIAHRLLDRCTLASQDAQVGVMVKREYHLACPGSLGLPHGRAIHDPVPILSGLVELGVPLVFVLTFFSTKSMLVRLKVRGNLCKLQVLALDVFDIGAFFAQALHPDVFMYLQEFPVASNVLVMLLPIATLSVLIQALLAFQLLDRSSKVDPEHKSHWLLSLGGRSLLFALTLDFPFLVLRLWVAAQTASMMQALLILKNAVCCLNKLSVAVTGDSQNALSFSLAQFAGMSGHAAVDQTSSADIRSDSPEDIREKVADLTKLIEDQTLAAKCLTFQRAILGAQASILVGVTDLDAVALKEGFEAFDDNHDGTLSYAEVNLMMRAVANIIDERQIERFMREADTNKDGKIGYEEFATMIVRDPWVRSQVLENRPRVTQWWHFWE